MKVNEKLKIQSNENNRSLYGNRNLWSGILFGIGIVAFIDETVFHQLLHWHHFYDQSTKAIGLISDGFFHAFSWFATVGGLFMVADLRRRNAWLFKRWIGGVFLGAGGFQFYDGTIQHKLMRLHQIRYNVPLLPYDMIWHIISTILILVGIVLIIRSSKRVEKQELLINNE
jgi:uncharacterized membrane protein